MKKRIIALFGALALLLTFFTACGNGATQQSDKPKTNDPQLVVAINPMVVYDNDAVVIPFNDINKAMGKDSQSSTLSAIADSDWGWVYNYGENGWTNRAVYGFGRWKNGAGTQAKGVFAYNFSQAGSTSLGLYDTQSNELATYQGETLPESGMLLSAVVGAEEGLMHTASQAGMWSLSSGTITAVEQVAGVKTGFLAEDGTARSASVRILFNGAQIWSGTLCNSTASEDGVAVTQLTYPQIDDLPAVEGSALLFTMELNAQANSDEDITQPTDGEDGKWQVVRKSTQVLDEDTTPKDSDVTTDDGSILMITNYQFTFTIVRDKAYLKKAVEYSETIMRRTAAEVFIGKEGKETKYELVIGVCAERPESKKIYDELIGARADNAGDYIIRLVGTKIYIVGANDDALFTAMDYFLETFIKDDKGKIPAKYNYYHKPDHVVYTLAGDNIATYTIRTERYPSLIVQRAAEAIQEAVLEDCGYIMTIKPMNYNGTDLGDKEIRIGPMNGALKVDRQYDTRFTSGNWQQYMTIDDDGMLDGDYGYWQIKFSGKNVLIEGGAAYSVNVGTMALLAELKKNRSVDTSYTKSGNYTSAYDWKTKTQYDTVDFSMTDGYGLSFAEEFDYAGTDKEKEKVFRSLWLLDEKPGNQADEEMVCYNPQVYGKNYWLDGVDGNNYYFMVANKRNMATEGSDVGYEGTRAQSQGYWGFRYGIWETRMVMGTRNGTTSAIWGVTDPPYERVGAYLEIDIYENYGQDCFVPCTHHSQDGTYLGNYHFQEPYLQEACWHLPNEGEHFYDTFHHITVDWSHDFINFYFDGVCVSRMPMTNHEQFKYYRNGIALWLSMGVPNRSYSMMRPLGSTEKQSLHIPRTFMEDVSKYFEVQLIDYTRIHQTSNDDVEIKQAESEMKFTSRYGKVKK